MLWPLREQPPRRSTSAAPAARGQPRSPRAEPQGWNAASDRPDPIVLLEQQDETREPDLVPVRHGRMMVSPFTFFRGAAKIMAADLKNTPRAGLTVQLCGDAHLSNFGAFASPERRLLFDLNDFDETLPGPFEYDVKRMAASFLIAAQNNGFAKANATAVTMAAVAAYRKAMAEFAQTRTLDIWYAHRDEEQIMAAAEDDGQQEEGGQGGQTQQEEHRQGAHPRQPAGTVQARGAGRRAVPHREPAADRHPLARPGRHPRRVARGGRSDHPGGVPCLPRHVAGRPARPPREVPHRRRGAQGCRRRERRHARVHRPAAGTR